MLCFWCLPLFPQCLLLSTSVVALNFGRRGGEGRGGEGRGGEGRVVVNGYPARDLNFSSRKSQCSWLLGVRDKFWRFD